MLWRHQRRDGQAEDSRSARVLSEGRDVCSRSLPQCTPSLNNDVDNGHFNLLTEYAENAATTCGKLVQLRRHPFDRRTVLAPTVCEYLPRADERPSQSVQPRTHHVGLIGDQSQRIGGRSMRRRLRAVDRFVGSLKRCPDCHSAIRGWLSSKPGRLLWVDRHDGIVLRCQSSLVERAHRYRGPRARHLRTRDEAPTQKTNRTA